MLRVAVLVLFAALPGVASASPSLVVDIGTGRVLHAEDAFKRWNPASLTKLMTAYAAFREIASGNLTLQSPVRISSNARNNPPARLGYPAGTVLTLDAALTIMIVKSANDVAVAVGESVSGEEADFVARMNAEAARLGMADTHFANPNGLYDAGQYTTAHDLAILVRAIRNEFPQFAHYFSTEAVRIGEETAPTYNILIGRFDGADGMKTGFVCASGFNLAGTATRDSTTLAAIVLGEKSQQARAEKAAVLLEQGFSALPREAEYPLLGEMAAPEGATTDVADMTSVVCTDEARANRWDGREVEGYMTFDTPSIHALTRAPEVVPVRTGGAVGSSKSATMLLGRLVRAIPVPDQKPERVTLYDDSDLEKYGLRPGFDAPVPGRRPES
ncbi:MAG: D-alanyl-D-alanine carboxypeptidase family protein [Oricola sp.]